VHVNVIVGTIKYFFHELHGRAACHFIKRKKDTKGREVRNPLSGPIDPRPAASKRPRTYRSKTNDIARNSCKAEAPTTSIIDATRHYVQTKFVP
jgi:hypothetical protein